MTRARRPRRPTLFMAPDCVTSGARFASRGSERACCSPPRASRAIDEPDPDLATQDPYELDLIQRARHSPHDAASSATLPTPGLTTTSAPRTFARPPAAASSPDEPPQSTAHPEPPTPSAQIHAQHHTNACSRAARNRAARNPTHDRARALSLAQPHFPWARPPPHGPTRCCPSPSPRPPLMGPARTSTGTPVEPRAGRPRAVGAEQLAVADQLLVALMMGACLRFTPLPSRTSIFSMGDRHRSSPATYRNARKPGAEWPLFQLDTAPLSTTDTRDLSESSARVHPGYAVDGRDRASPNQVVPRSSPIPADQAELPSPCELPLRHRRPLTA